MEINLKQENVEYDKKIEQLLEKLEKNNEKDYFKIFEIEKMKPAQRQIAILAKRSRPPIRTYKEKEDQFIVTYEFVKKNKTTDSLVKEIMRAFRHTIKEKFVKLYSNNTYLIYQHWKTHEEKRLKT